jgi:hypothetical protein
MHMQIPSRRLTIIALSNCGIHPLDLDLPELYLGPTPLGGALGHAAQGERRMP